MAVAGSGDPLAPMFYLMIAPVPIASIGLLMGMLALCTNRRMTRLHPAPSLVLIGAYSVAAIAFILAVLLVVAQL